MTLTIYHILLFVFRTQCQYKFFSLESCVPPCLCLPMGGTAILQPFWPLRILWRPTARLPQVLVLAGRKKKVFIFSWNFTFLYDFIGTSLCFMLCFFILSTKRIKCLYLGSLPAPGKTGANCGLHCSSTRLLLGVLGSVDTVQICIKCLLWLLNGHFKCEPPGTGAIWEADLLTNP